MAAGDAQIVRALELAAIRALLEGGHGQRIVRPAHAALRRRGLSFRNGHFGTFSRTNRIKSRYARMVLRASAGRADARRTRADRSRSEPRLYRFLPHLQGSVGCKVLKGDP